MRKNTKRIIIGSTLVVILIAAFIVLMIYLNNSQNNYTFLEKKWMDNNSNSVIDVYVQKDLPIFSINGSGVYYDLIKDLETDTNLTINPTYTSSNMISLEEKSSTNTDEITIFEDHYVMFAKNNAYITDIALLGKISVGVLKDDLPLVSKNLSNYSNIEYKIYQTIDALEEAVKKEEILYGIMPLYENIDMFMNNELSIIYHFEGLNKFYTISFTNAPKELISIVKKFINKWEERKNEKFNLHYSNLYYDINKFTEIEKESIINDDFLVGYIDNLPYEGKINNTFTGLTGKYLSKFSEFSGATYKYINYKNLDKLSKAITNKKVDVVYNAYSYNNANYLTSGYVGNKNVVVLIPNDSTLIVNSMNDLNGKEVLMLEGRSLINIYNTKNIFKVKGIKNINELLNKGQDKIIIIEKEMYDYYKTKELSDHKVAYVTSDYVYESFLLNNSNESFNKLFTFYMSTLSGKTIGEEATIQTTTDKNNNMFLSFIVDNVFYLILILAFIGFVLYKITNKVRLSKKIRKEDKLLYLDVMTNLKNRNYLNDNIEYWEKNIIFPQTIIILDLNDIKELNDKNGHEAGDKQIKACANILIKTQRENSEIMRTDGNEFTIYLVGYEEKMIMSYIRKLNKELKNSLPFKEYGVSIGYSMINDEIKTMDDAINESLIMVNDNKVRGNEKN